MANIKNTNALFFRYLDDMRYEYLGWTFSATNQTDKSHSTSKRISMLMLKLKKIYILVKIFQIVTVRPPEPPNAYTDLAFVPSVSKLIDKTAYHMNISQNSGYNSIIGLIVYLYFFKPK